MSFAQDEQAIGSREEARSPILFDTDGEILATGRTPKRSRLSARNLLSEFSRLPPSDDESVPSPSPDLANQFPRWMQMPAGGRGSSQSTPRSSSGSSQSDTPGTDGSELVIQHRGCISTSIYLTLTLYRP